MLLFSPAIPLRFREFEQPAAAASYRPDIDGMRALSIWAVVSYHAFPDWVPGGFVGVDVFFVLSGFLITGLILDKIASGSFSILSFYQGRLQFRLKRSVFLGQFGHRRQVLSAPGQFLVRPEQRVGHLELLNSAFGSLLVIPEPGLALLGFQFVATYGFAPDVKESPATGSAERTVRRFADGGPGSSRYPLLESERQGV